MSWSFDIKGAADKDAAKAEVQQRKEASGNHFPDSAKALVDALSEAGDMEQAARAALIPTEQDAINLIQDCYQRLKELGWNDAIYCPKDGTEFDSIEIGSTGIHNCHYSGEWPSGHWWVAEAGDLWPSRPILYRLPPNEKASETTLPHPRKAHPYRTFAANRSGSELRKAR